MSGPGQQVLQWLTDRYQSGRPLLLLFDFDGTLVPLAEHPNKVRLSPSTREALTELARLPNIFVGIISGRGLADVREKVDLVDIYYAGCGGLELDLLGIQVEPPEMEAGCELLDNLQSELGPLLENFPNAWVERKPLGLTVHYRKLADDQSPAFQEQVRAVLVPYGDRVKVWEVASAFEVVPAFGAGKAAALQRISEDAARDAIPFYAGDEANDTEALQLAADLGGLAVGVGPNAPPSAQVFLESPRALVQVLHRFIDEVEVTLAHATLAKPMPFPPESRTNEF